MDFKVSKVIKHMFLHICTVLCIFFFFLFRVIWLKTNQFFIEVDEVI